MVVVLLGLEAVRLAVGLVFALSAAGKLHDPWRFVWGVVEYRVLPVPLALAYGLVLLPLEGFVAVTLISGWMATIGALLAVVLLGSFLVAVALNLHRRRAIPCHCFGGAASEQISKRSLARIGLLLAAMLVVLLGQRSAEILLVSIGVATVYSGYRLLDGLLWLSLAAAVLTAGMWLLTLPDLLHPWRRLHHGAEPRLWPF